MKRPTKGKAPRSPAQAVKPKAAHASGATEGPAVHTSEGVRLRTERAVYELEYQLEPAGKPENRQRYAFRARCIQDSKDELVGRDVFIKAVVVPGNDFERGNSWIDREHLALSVAKGILGTAELLDHGRCSIPNDPDERGRSEPQSVLFNVHEWIYGISLQEWREKQESLSLGDWWCITFKLLRTLSELHTRGIVHGDICPSNIMVSRPYEKEWETHLVDLGESLILPSHVTEFQAGSNEPSLDKPFGPGNEKVSVQADIYSIGTTLIALALNDFDIGSWKNMEGAPLHVGCPIDDFSAELFSRLNATPNIDERLKRRSLAHILALCLDLDHHHQPETPVAVVRHFHAIADDLPLVGRRRQEHGRPIAEVVGDELEDIRRYFVETEQKNKLFAEMMREDLIAMRRRFRTSHGAAIQWKDRVGSIDVGTDREDQLHAFMLMFRRLHRGDIYRAKTLFTFHSDEMLGISGRFHRATLEALNRGATIQRLIWNNDAEAGSKEWENFLRAQKELADTANVMAPGIESSFIKYTVRKKCPFPDLGNGAEVRLERGFQVATLQLHDDDGKPQHIGVFFITRTNNPVKRPLGQDRPRLVLKELPKEQARDWLTEFENLRELTIWEP